MNKFISTINAIRPEKKVTSHRIKYILLMQHRLGYILEALISENMRKIYDFFFRNQSN